MKPLLPDNFEKNAISILLAVMAAFMIAAAVCRHLWPQWRHLPLSAAGCCLTWIASLGMARAAALGLHVRAGFIEKFARDKTRRRLGILSDAAFLVFAALTFAIGCAVLAVSLEKNGMSARIFVHGALPCGSVLTMGRLVRRIRTAFGEGGA